jgi:two-component sensor histidine kinase
MSWEGSGAPVWSAERLRVAADAAGVGLWSWDVDTDAIAMDDRGRALWGLPPGGGPLAFADLSSRIAPPDLDACGPHSPPPGTPGPYQIDFRIRRDDGVRWVSARGRGATRASSAAPCSASSSTARNKEAEEARELLAGEMSHRVKNLFAIASGLTAIAARLAATTAEMARDLTERLATLGRAHDLIRPCRGKGGAARPPCSATCSPRPRPLRQRGRVGDRVRVSLPEVRVGETAATTLALVAYELATNSVKYGRLSAAGGTLDVSCAARTARSRRLDGAGRAAGVRARGPRGFGSRLMSRSVVGQLGGSVAFDWRPEGLVVTLRLGKARLAA